MISIALTVLLHTGMNMVYGQSSGTDSISVSFNEIKGNRLRVLDFYLTIEDDDQTIQFSYFKNGELFQRYRFERFDSLIFLTNNPTHPERQLALSDTFWTVINEERIRVFKFETAIPLIDGDEAFLFSEKHGLIAFISYFHGNRLILTIWDDAAVSPALEASLIIKGVEHLKPTRNERLLPYGKLQVIDDED